MESHNPFMFQTTNQPTVLFWFGCFKTNPRTVNFQGPCAHSKPSLRQRHEAKFTFLTPGVVLIFSFPPGNQTWLAGKSLTKWKLYREIIHKWSILHCNVWLYRKALKPLLGLLVLSLCQPPGQFHLFARCFFLVFFITQWMEKSRQYRACMGLKKTCTCSPAYNIDIHLQMQIYNLYNVQFTPPPTEANKYFDTFQAKGNI